MKISELIQREMATWPEGSWPDDDWVSITPTLDANFWTDDEDQIHLALYPVVNGQTKTDRFIEIF